MSVNLDVISKKELESIIERTIERKLMQILGDPDHGLVLKKTLQKRLESQLKKVSQGEIGKPLRVIGKTSKR
ncbi:MAG: hypothetical protein KBF93_06390 [Leptospiraceae bacterium]|nr:hypothetical protein [Leptospiraceae bacterium]